MADKQPAKKRQVKNPETFRERAIKASEGVDRPRRTEKVKSAGGKLVKPIGAPFKKAAGSKPVKPLRKPAHVLGKIIVPTYVRNSWQELRKVTWPTWEESRRLTVAVLIFAIIFGALIAAVDYGLDKLFRNILLK
ncbi:MAG TPA: preprotein translocase subunit SecE [Candidatus Saccharimonadales bacterium]|nr:preprotein translocase subunit SecE [Candidatus Saccharimonadales bacterium]